MKIILRSIVALFVFLALSMSATVLAEDFYQGKTIRFIVGAAAGGGYDTYTRGIARDITNHIPGKPATVVENMTGAGGLVAANYIYKQASADGLTIGVFNNSLVVQKGLGDPRIGIDFRKLGWIGAPSVGVPMCTGDGSLVHVSEFLAEKLKLNLELAVQGVDDYLDDRAWKVGLGIDLDRLKIATAIYAKQVEMKGPFPVQEDTST